MQKNNENHVTQPLLQGGVSRWLSFTSLRIIEFSDSYKLKSRLIVRNHWSSHFNDSFLLIVDRKSQGPNLDVFRFGLFNFCLCLIIDRSERY